MIDKPTVTLRPATPEEVQLALVHALKFNGKKQFTHSRDLMAEITAAHVADALRAGLFVVMKSLLPALPQAADCPYGTSAAAVASRGRMEE